MKILLRRNQRICVTVSLSDGPRIVHGQVEKFSGVEMDGLDWIEENRTRTAVRDFSHT